MCITLRLPEHRSGRTAGALLILLAAFSAAGPAQAQGRSSTGPAAAFGGGRPAGDPRGAVRALGSVQDSGSDHKMVQVPHLGGEGKVETRGVPEGTAR